MIVDDFFIISKDKETINALLKNLSKTFKLTGEGYFKSYFGINVSKYPNGNITMRQSVIINKISNRLGISNESKMHDKQANVILTRDE